MYLTIGTISLSLLPPIVLIATGPILGHLNDRTNRGYHYLFVTTAVMFVATIGIHFTNIRIGEPSKKGLIALFCFAAIMYCYQLSLVFYNSLMRTISSANEYLKASGWGVAAGWLGSVVGIFAVLPFVEGMIGSFGPGGRAQAFLPSALFFGLAAAMSLFLMRGISSGKVKPAAGDVFFPQFLDRLRSTPNSKLLVINLIRQLRAKSQEDKSVWYFLCAVFLFMDAVLTIEANASFYLSAVMQFNEREIAALILLLIVSAALGALVPAKLLKRVHPKTILFAVLCGWILTLLVISLTTNRIVFSVLFGVVGFLYGALAAVMRALFISLVPVDRTSRYFGFYVSFLRFSTLIGPLVWILVAHISKGLETARYRLSMGAMAVLIALSFVFLRKVPRVPIEQGGDMTKRT